MSVAEAVFFVAYWYVGIVRPHLGGQSNSCQSVAQSNNTPCEQWLDQRCTKLGVEHYTGSTEANNMMAWECRGDSLSDALKLCRALGHDMNTVEFAFHNGVPYAIDFTNSAPDLDIASLGEWHFNWAVDAMTDLVIERVRIEGHEPETVVQVA